MTEHRLTQAERRTRTRTQVLTSASGLFGAHGYSGTSLDDIAQACALTTRPIYHYFGNKKALFAAVNEQQEQRILTLIDSSDHETSPLQAWSQFLQLCEDAQFRQIVLIDSPNILGRERWQRSTVMQAVLSKARQRNAAHNESSSDGAWQFRRELKIRMIISALAEAAMMVAEASDVTVARQQAQQVFHELLLAAGA